MTIFEKSAKTCLLLASRRHVFALFSNIVMNIAIHRDNQTTMYAYFKKEEIIYFGLILPNILTFLSQKRSKR